MQIGQRPRRLTISPPTSHHCGQQGRFLCFHSCTNNTRCPGCCFMLRSLSASLIMLSVSRWSEITVLGFQLYAFPNFPFMRVLEWYLQHSDSGLIEWFLFLGTIWRWFCQRGGADPGWGGCCQRIGRIQRSGQVRMDKGGSGASFHNKFSHLCPSIRSLWNLVDLYTNSLIFSQFPFFTFNAN